MSVLKKIVLVAATIAVAVFAPQFAPLIAKFIGVSAFMGAVIGATILAVGLYALNAILMPSGKGTEMEAGKINVRIGEPPRWICAGRVRQGGGVLFAEFDSAGNLWYLIVHCDSILVDAVQYYLDDEAVTLDGSGIVQNKAFRLKTNKTRDIATVDGEGQGCIQIWTTTYSESNPTPPAISALAAAFPSQWTSDHKLVGTTYSVVKMSALPLEHRSKIYRWRGPLGLGEPSLSIVGDWSLVYDPRDETQVLGDRTTYKFSRNAELIWAWFRTHPYGRRKSESSIDWDNVAAQADICDQNVVGIEGTTKRYRCDVAIPENKQRIIAEQGIMLAMDGQLVFDEDGKCWARAGYYYAPSLRLTRNRDIVAMESVEAQNGESETQGVVVRFTDPSANYAMQPSAAWFNPNYYVPGQAPQLLTVDIPEISDHNQAMRIAKAIGMRSQPLHKIAPTVSLRGLRARQERIFELVYDNTFAGDYEIVTPVELDGQGIFTGFGAVPVDADRWNLLEGEEDGVPGTSTGGGSVTVDLPVVTSFQYRNGRIEAVFDPPTRSDVTYQFQYIAADDEASELWLEMYVDMGGYIAYSDSLAPGIDYIMRYRSFTNGGAVSDWSDPPTTLGFSQPAGGLLQQFIASSYIAESAQGYDVVTIASDGTLTIQDHTRRYTDGLPDVSVDGDVIATGLAIGDTRAIGYDDQMRVGGAVTYNLYESDIDARATTAHPYRHYVGYFTVPTTGTSTGGGGGVPGGGGFCVTADTPILLAAPDFSGPGMSKVAADLQVGDWLWTQHETTLAFGAYQIEALSFVEEPVYSAPDLPRATANHKFWLDGEWKLMKNLGVEDGIALVARITVHEAHTYISNGVLSHNIKDDPYT